MKHTLITRQIGIGGVGLGMMSVGIFALLVWSGESDVRARVPALKGPVYAPTREIDEAPRYAVETWNDPARGEREAEWRSDLFTPPEIFYDSANEKFVARPRPAVSAPLPPSSFDLELIEVKREPFRLQLIGHAANDREASGVFENRLTGEVFLARTGQRVEELGLRIEALDLRVDSVTATDGMSVPLRVARATVCEDTAVGLVTLTEGECQLAGEWVALIAAKEDVAPRSARVGETLKVGTGSYRVEKILCDPPQVEIVRVTASRETPERRMLPLRTQAPDPVPSS